MSLSTGLWTVKFSRWLLESLTPTLLTEPLLSLKQCPEVSQKAYFGGGLVYVSECHGCTVLKSLLESEIGLIPPGSSRCVLDRDDSDFAILYEVLVEFESSDVRGKVVNDDIDEGVSPPVALWIT